MTALVLCGDCRPLLRARPAGSVHTVCTSPPYWGLRDYGVEPTLWGGDPGCEHAFGEEVHDRSRRSPGTQGSTLTGDGRYQATASRFETRSHFCSRCGCWRGVLGLEPDYRMFVDHVVEVFREVRRVLRDDGTAWVNLGDSYATGAGPVGEHPGVGAQGAAWSDRPPQGASSSAGYGRTGRRGGTSSARAAMGKHLYVGVGVPNTVDPLAREGIGPLTQPNRMPQHGLKPKDLCGIPWRVVLALQDDGWWLRQDIVWAKPNPMPESIEDRCTKAHEYVFLLSKREAYYYDAVAIAEDASENTHARASTARAYSEESPPGVSPKSAEESSMVRAKKSWHSSTVDVLSTRNKRSVWTVEDDFFGARAVPPENWRTSGNLERQPPSERGAPEGNGKQQSSHVPWEGSSRNKRSVWTIATQPYAEAHFATFPPALVEPMILAATSARGCCRGCGAGWRRITAPTARYAALLGTGYHDHADDGGKGMMQNRGANRQNAIVDAGLVGKEVETVGWYPGCACEGLPALAKLPARPKVPAGATQAAREALLATWREACRPTYDSWRQACAAAAGVETTPAVVLDPFGGSGTTAMVADRLQRDAVVVELNPKYAEMARRRIAGDAPLIATVAAE